MTPGLLTPELFWLTLTVILTGLLWVPYVLNRFVVRGLFGTLDNPSRDAKPHAPWANRLMFAHDNAVENLIVFAPLVLILSEIDYSTKWTVYACAVYFGPVWLMSSSTRWEYRYFAHCPLPSASWRRRCWRWQSSNWSSHWACVRRDAAGLRASRQSS